MPTFIFSRVLFLALLAHSALCQPEEDYTRQHEDNEVLAAEPPVLRTLAPPSVPDHMYVRLPRLDTKDKLRLWIMKHALSLKARDSCPAQMTDSMASLQADLAEVKKLLKEQTDALRTLTRGQRKLWEERKRQQKRHVQTKKILKRVYRSCTARPASGDVSGGVRQREPAQRDQPDSSGSPPQDFSVLTLPAVTTTEAGQGLQTTNASVSEIEQSSEEPTSVEETMVILDEEGDTVEVNLTSGVVRGNQTGMTWQMPLRKGRSEVCSFQGVLKATFTPPGKGQGREKLQIDLWMEDPTDWVFNLGDSEGNDGRSGDGPLQENDCEVEIKGSGFFVYASDRAADPLDKLLFGSDYFLQGRLTLTVSDETLAWDNHRGGQKTLSLPSLFALAGQSDKQGPVNFDVFLGLNRVVAGKYRSGHGLCYLTTKWV